MAITSRQRIFQTCYGPEFAGRLLDQWAYLNKVELDRSRPRKAQRQRLRLASDEHSTGVFDLLTFNSRLRQECLNAAWFLPVVDTRQRIEDWRIDCNDHWPHSALGNLTPSAFAARLKPARKVA